MSENPRSVPTGAELYNLPGIVARVFIRPTGQHLFLLSRELSGDQNVAIPYLWLEDDGDYTEMGGETVDDALARLKAIFHITDRDMQVIRKSRKNYEPRWWEPAAGVGMPSLKPGYPGRAREERGGGEPGSQYQEPVYATPLVLWMIDTFKEEVEAMVNRRLEVLESRLVKSLPDTSEGRLAYDTARQHEEYGIERARPGVRLATGGPRLAHLSMGYGVVSDLPADRQSESTKLFLSAEENIKKAIKGIEMLKVRGRIKVLSVEWDALSEVPREIVESTTKQEKMAGSLKSLENGHQRYSADALAGTTTFAGMRMLDTWGVKRVRVALYDFATESVYSQPQEFAFAWYYQAIVNASDVPELVPYLGISGKTVHEVAFEPWHRRVEEDERAEEARIQKSEDEAEVKWEKDQRTKHLLLTARLKKRQATLQAIEDTKYDLALAAWNLEVARLKAAWEARRKLDAANKVSSARIPFPTPRLTKNQQMLFRRAMLTSRGGQSLPAGAHLRKIVKVFLPRVSGGGQEVPVDMTPTWKSIWEVACHIWSYQNGFWPREYWDVALTYVPRGAGTEREAELSINQIFKIMNMIPISHYSPRLGAWQTKASGRRDAAPDYPDKPLRVRVSLPTMRMDYRRPNTPMNNKLLAYLRVFTGEPDAHHYILRSYSGANGRATTDANDYPEMKTVTVRLLEQVSKWSKARRGTPVVRLRARTARGSITSIGGKDYNPDDLLREIGWSGQQPSQSTEDMMKSLKRQGATAIRWTSAMYDLPQFKTHYHRTWEPISLETDTARANREVAMLEWMRAQPVFEVNSIPRLDPNEVVIHVRSGTSRLPNVGIVKKGRWLAVAEGEEIGRSNPPAEYSMEDEPRRVGEAELLPSEMFEPSGPVKTPVAPGYVRVQLYPGPMEDHGEILDIPRANVDFLAPRRYRDGIEGPAGIRPLSPPHLPVVLRIAYVSDASAPVQAQWDGMKSRGETVPVTLAMLERWWNQDLSSVSIEAQYNVIRVPDPMGDSRVRRIAHTFGVKVDSNDLGQLVQVDPRRITIDLDSLARRFSFSEFPVPLNEEENALKDEPLPAGRELSVQDGRQKINLVFGPPSRGTILRFLITKDRTLIWDSRSVPSEYANHDPLSLLAFGPESVSTYVQQGLYIKGEIERIDMHRIQDRMEFWFMEWTPAYLKKWFADHKEDEGGGEWNRMKIRVKNGMTKEVAIRLAKNLLLHVQRAYNGAWLTRITSIIFDYDRNGEDFISREIPIERDEDGRPLKGLLKTLDDYTKRGFRPEEEEEENPHGTVAHYWHFAVKDSALFVPGSFRVIDPEGKGRLKLVIGKLPGKSTTMIQKIMVSKTAEADKARARLHAQDFLERRRTER